METYSNANNIETTRQPQLIRNDSNTNNKYTYYNLENFYVSPFSKIEIVTFIANMSDRRTIEAYFHFPAFFHCKKGSKKAARVVIHKFKASLGNVELEISDEDLLETIIERLKYAEKSPKFLTFEYYQDNSTASEYASTIIDNIDKRYNYTPLSRAESEPYKHQTLHLQKPRGCDLYFDDLLPNDFIKLKANCDCTTIVCPKLHEVVEREKKTRDARFV